ncbi:MAG: tRNA (adenosine(37)-N6)-dimethylallyltransferase MiaA [bacterium]|nr:tRNA (adenosine(37)-N6)-dimethylallyltransferase MiaA [bacterium]
MQKIIIIAGPTASGKTKAAIELAQKINAEIISVDSRQIYKEISIGTAKPSYKELCGIPHHGFNLVSIKDDFNVANFLDFFIRTAENITKHKKQIILCGGTGLYLDACLNGLSEIPEINPQIKLEVAQIPLPNLYQKLKKIDPETKVDANNPHRVMRSYEVFLATGIPLTAWHKKPKKNKPEYQFELRVLDLPRQYLYDRINQRVETMFKNGLIEETKKLDPIDLKKAGIGYNHVWNYLNNNQSLKEAKESMKQDTRRFAKRQLTWFRKYNFAKWLNSLQIF